MSNVIDINCTRTNSLDLRVPGDIIGNSIVNNIQKEMNKFGCRLILYYLILTIVVTIVLFCVL